MLATVTPSKDEVELRTGERSGFRVAFSRAEGAPGMRRLAKSPLADDSAGKKGGKEMWWVERESVTVTRS